MVELEHELSKFLGYNNLSKVTFSGCAPFVMVKKTIFQTVISKCGVFVSSDRLSSYQTVFNRTQLAKKRRDNLVIFTRWNAYFVL
jgi:hypothetical protein